MPAASPPASSSGGDGFDAVWREADAIPGWLTRDQARRLWDLAGGLSGAAPALEIGSHQGRSTVVLAAALRDRGVPLVAIDPFVDGAMFGGAATRARLEANLAAAGLADGVRLVVDKSTAVRPGWDTALGLVYVDGKHDYWTVSDDLRWAEHLPEGAPLAVHDAFSSIGVTLGLLVHVAAGSQLRYRGRAGSLAVFERGRPNARDRARLLAQLPWFARNVVVKVGLRALRPFGFRRPDPY